MRCLLLVVIVLPQIGCGLPAARERAAAREKQRTEHIAKLKSYVPADVLATVDPEFYTYPGFRDWYRIPLVYPYSITCIDTTNSGHFSKHDGQSKIPDGHGEQYVQGLSRLTEFDFDARFLVGRTDGEHQDRASHPWTLVEFSTGKIEYFPSKDELAAAAKERGYTGSMEFESVKTQYEKVFP